MSLALLDKVKKYYGDRLILDIDKFEILDDDKFGIVGENGVGKTTLIKILIGELEPEEGHVSLNNSYTYISQKGDFTENNNNNDYSNLKVNKILNVPEEYEEFLSGGEKVKIKIAKALSENANLIIADEPTANLDEESINELEKMLKAYKGALLLVSHDREFLDKLCNSIIEIEEGKLKFYKGNYSKYVDLKYEERKNQEREYNQYRREKERLEKAIQTKEHLKERIHKSPKGMGPSEAKTIKMGDQNGKKNIDGNIKAIKSRIEHLEVKEKPKTQSEIIINVQKGMKILSKTPIEVEKLKLYGGDKLLLNEVTFSIKKGQKVGIIGENGCGKTTLLNKILDKYNNMNTNSMSKNTSENIKIKNKIKIGYFDQGQSILEDNKNILENIKKDCSYDESFIRINLSEFGFKENSVFKIVSDLSGGEKVKVALCKILLSDNNFLILDEPTNYLDIKSMGALESALINTDKTIILVSHDRKFISNVCNDIFEIKDKQIKEFHGKYEDYINEKNRKPVDKQEKHHQDELLLIENRLSEVLSLLSIEIDSIRKEELDCEYNELLKKKKSLK